MAKCEKCGEEYPNGTEHICLLQGEQKPETNTPQKEKTTPAEEIPPQKTEDPTREKIEEKRG